MGPNQKKKTDFRTAHHLFGHLHQLENVGMRLIELAGGELGIVGAVNSWNYRARASASCAKKS